MNENTECNRGKMKEHETPFTFLKGKLSCIQRGQNFKSLEKFIKHYEVSQENSLKLLLCTFYVTECGCGKVSTNPCHFLDQVPPRVPTFHLTRVRNACQYLMDSYNPLCQFHIQHHHHLQEQE